jgi:hypothetical protein
MRGILFPNSNVIFDAQDKNPGVPPDPTETPANPYARVYGGWEAYPHGTPASVSEEAVVKSPAALRESSRYAGQTAQAHHSDAIADVAVSSRPRTRRGHDVYRARVIDDKPMTMEQRCGA